jgi:hypothetical protein
MLDGNEMDFTLEYILPEAHEFLLPHFLVRGVWFPSHLLLEGTDHIKSFGS